MIITVLGTRGEIEETAPRHYRHSGILINKAIMLDCGEAEFLKYRPKAIFVTHLHPDHAVFILKPISTEIPIYSPEGSEYSITIPQPVKVGKHIITPIPTHHSSKVKSCAYVVEAGAKRILYTGDIVWMDRKYRKNLKPFDLVISEASYIKKGGLIRKDNLSGKLYGHAGIPNIIQLFKEYTDHFLFVHFGSWFFKNIMESKKKLYQLGEQFDVRVTIGYDGLQLGV